MVATTWASQRQAPTDHSCYHSVPTTHGHGFLCLIPELRNQIYDLVLPDTDRAIRILDPYSDRLGLPGLLQVSQTRAEASPMYYGNRAFELWLYSRLFANEPPLTKPLLAWLQTVAPHHLRLTPSVHVAAYDVWTRSFPLRLCDRDGVPPAWRGRVDKAWLPISRFVRTHGLDVGRWTIDDGGYEGEYLSRPRLLAHPDMLKSYMEVEMEVEWTILLRSTRLGCIVR